MDEIFRRVGWASVCFTIYGFVLGYVVAKGSLFAVLASFAALVPALVFLALWWTEEAMRHEAGIRGEIKVAAVLAQLPMREYWTAHDLTLPGAKANLDHVVVGPNGVWLLDAKHWGAQRVEVKKGVIWTGNREFPKAKLDSLKHRSVKLKEYLNSCGIAIAWVQPVLVFSRDFTVVEGQDSFHGVEIVSFRGVSAKILARRPENVLDVSLRTAMRIALEKIAER